MSNKNLIIFYLAFPVLFLAGFFGFGLAASAAQIVINEVQIEGETKNDDFIELYNPDCEPVALSGWKLKKITKEGTTPSSLGSLKGSVPAKGHFLWANTSGGAFEDYDYSTKTYYLSENYSLALFDSNDKQIEALTWGIVANPFPNSFAFPDNPGKNQSLVRKQNSFVLSNKPFPQTSSDINLDELSLCQTKEYSKNIYINEIFPAPVKDSGLSEFVELFNGGDADEKLDGWYLQDRAKKTCDLSGETAETGGFLIIKNDPNKKCALALNDTQGEVLELYDPKDNLVSSVSYDGSAKKGKSYSFDGENWRWSQYLTPGEDNLFNNLPIVSAKKENKIYVNTYAQFSAKGSDKDKEKLKFTWDFGDGHKSYLQNTRHKYAKTGNYTATLKVTDGNEDVLTTFDIKVIKFPKIKISVQEIMPNPKGLDAKNEYIVLKNKSDEKINLKSWSIATGSKNLYNHPITKDFVLKKGQSKKITHKYSKFALVNTKGKIEIRYPNGKAAYELKYSKDKIAESEIYRKIDGRWVWIAPPAENKSAPAETPIENNPIIIETQDIELQNNLGKYSADPQWQKKKENTIFLAGYATNLSLPENLETQPRVLGASTVRETESLYVFTPPSTSEPHWAVKFVNSFGEILNSLLNKALDFFS